MYHEFDLRSDEDVTIYKVNALFNQYNTNRLVNKDDYKANCVDNNACNKCMHHSVFHKHVQVWINMIVYIKHFTRIKSKQVKTIFIS